MVSGDGMDICIVYTNDGHWRVKTNDENPEPEGYARTKKANLNRPYGRKCEWEVKLNMQADVGMEPAPDLQVIPLNEDDTNFRKVCAMPTISTFPCV